MPQPKIDNALRAALKDRGLSFYAYQPIPPGRARLVPDKGDEWLVTLSRTDRASWADGATYGVARGRTAEEAIRAVLDAPRGLEAAIDALVAVLRA